MNQAQNLSQSATQTGTQNGSQNGTPTDTTTLYLLTIRGNLASPTLEAARTIHNQTAGLQSNVVVAQSLGDLSHMVYVPAMPQSGAGAGEFLILDVWNNLEGLNQFFANPHVQEQAGQIFATRDPVVWMPAEGFLGYNLPAPYGQNNRIVAIVRGKVHSIAAAKATHNAIVASQIAKARRAGDISHQAYVRLAPPNSPEALEFFAVDVWLDAAAMGEYYADPGFQSAIGELFAAPPDVSVWTHPTGDWVEW
jgi:quinol monooxygenase YgiN